MRCSTLSYEKTVIDNEILGNVLRLLKGIEVNDETLAIDVIKAVGPAGNFLAHDHTAAHFRNEFYFPKVSDRWNRITWNEKGSLNTHARAHILAEKILKTHRAAPIDPQVQAEIRRMFPGIKGEDLL